MPVDLPTDNKEAMNDIIAGLVWKLASDKSQPPSFLEGNFVSRVCIFYLGLVFLLQWLPHFLQFNRFYSIFYEEAFGANDEADKVKLLFLASGDLP